jgi:hypothetical protein
MGFQGNCFCHGYFFDCYCTGAINVFITMALLVKFIFSSSVWQFLMYPFAASCMVVGHCICLKITC